jgi:hypothetical protein
MRQREIAQTIGPAGVRVWLGNLPEQFSFEPSNWLIHVFDKKRSPSSGQSRYAGLRLRIHDFSGHLGAFFVPQEDEVLTVKIGIADLAIAGLQIRKGIPAKYAQVIMNEVVQTVDQIDFRESGTVEFKHGGYDPVYSNTEIFRMLTRGVLMLLAPDLEDTSEEQILTLVAEAITERGRGVR